MILNSQLPVYQFTRDGYEALEKEQEQLLAKRPEAVEDLRKAREMGDLSENGYYKAARANLSALDSRLRRLKHLIQYGKIIAQKTHDHVGFGCLVVVADGNQERTFQIVGDLESNPMEGKISGKSPIGKALMGKKTGAKVSVVVPAGTITYQIISIS